MREVILRPEAERDIEDIADYTIEQRGAPQSRKYIADLRLAIEELSMSALRYPLYEQVHPGLRRKRSAMRHIYYLALEDRVEILRIIHVQRDPGLHLRLERWPDED
jgi:toxin ParE1/3/4